MATRKSDIPTWVVPQTLSSYGDNFCSCRIHLWNSLPVQLHNPDITYGLFRRQLKAHLFREASTLWRSVTLVCSVLEEHVFKFQINRVTAVYLLKYWCLPKLASVEWLDGDDSISLWCGSETSGWVSRPTRPAGVVPLGGINFGGIGGAGHSLTDCVSSDSPSLSVDSCFVFLHDTHATYTSVKLAGNKLHRTVHRQTLWNGT